jgi:predicted nucleotide-binding protein (sugar kinase/HSP70/actin superfamily)
MYELLPFWQAFFNALGYRVIVSPPSSRELYLKGQGSIPSDTICYPAKLMHGHIQYLLEQGVDVIFYPCMTYNLDEGLGDNHYNCPVVAFYPEVIAANESGLEKAQFIFDYLGLHRPKEFPAKIRRILRERLGSRFSLPAVKAASAKAYAELTGYYQKVAAKGREIVAQARAEGRRIIVLAGRPYHVDGEINHGIDQLIAGFGAPIVTEDALSSLTAKRPGTVLNQWTYHSRLYAAAHYTGSQPDMSLVQLVSFGCGVDAITSDEVRDILEENGKIYTQIKIDEIANLGAVRIRLRSLLAAVGGEQRDD